MSQSDDSSDFDAILRGVGRAPPREPALAIVDERYSLGALLGEGSFGAVYEAHDRSRGERIALKILHRASSDALLRFKREFRALSRLSDPGFVKLYDLHGDGARLYFTMERIDGVPFDVWVRDPERLRPALASLARALEALHREGYVHRDVKPSNVLVEKSGRVVLLDFGLLHASSEERSATAMVGTPIYVAPEIASGKPPTSASDRYAVGVMLYEALTGELPFDGTAAEILARKQHATPPRVHDRAPNAPSDLALLADALLSTDPGERPHLDGFTGDAMPISTREDPRGAFVGRHRELEVLEGTRASRLVHVTGPSGVGKTALVERFVSASRKAGAHVLASRCHPRDHVPFVAVDELVDELTRMLVRLPPATARALAPLDVDAVVRAFPVLRAVPGFDVPVRPEGARSRVATALVDLLLRWPDRERWVIVIDDAQWGDADSAALLGALVDSRLPVTIVLVHRGDAKGPLVDELSKKNPEAPKIELEALEESAAKELARAMGAREEDLASMVQESGRHPLFLIELAREQAGGKSAGTRTLHEIVNARLAGLSQGAARAARLLAVAGNPLPLAVLRVAGITTSALDELRAARLVAHHHTDSVRIAHDRLRDVLFAAIDADAQKPIHRVLADALQVAAPDQAEALAFHLAGAGDRAGASTQLLRAARAATRARAFAHARALYMRLLAEDDRDKALRVEAAEVSALFGLSVEAADGLLAASRLTSGDEATLLRIRAGEHLLSAGHRERGEQIMDEQLARMGITVPSSTPGRVLGAVRDTIGRRVDRFWPRTTTALRLRALWCAARVAFVTDSVRGMALGAAFVREASASGVSAQDRLAAAFMDAVLRVSSEGPSGVAAGRSLIDAAFTDRADPQMVLFHAFAEGMILHLGLDIAGSAKAYERCVRTAVEHGLGHGYEETLGRGMQSACAFVAGDLTYLRTHMAALCTELEERDQLLAWVLTAFHRAYLVSLRSDVAGARRMVADIRRRWTSRGLELQDWWFDLAEIQFSLAVGDARTALRLADPRSRKYRERAYATFFHRHEAKVLQARAAIVAGDDLSIARDGVAMLARAPAAWARAQAECLSAGIESVSGNREAAVRSLRRAIPALDDAQMPLLRTLVDDALGTLVGGDEGRQLVTKARGQMKEWEIDRDTAFACTLPGRW